MLFSLVKKDFMIVRKYVFILFAALFKPENGINFGFLNTLSTIVLTVWGIVICLVIFLISALFSRIYEKTELP